MEKYHNKELSWLSFNHRVLMEAYDKTSPLYERIKFLSIYDSNLEEFLRNKLGALKRSADTQNYADVYSKDGAKKTLSKIQRIVVKGIAESLRVLNEDIIAELKSENIFILNQTDACSNQYKNELDSYFRSHILTYLKPKVLSNNYENDDYTFENIPYFFLRLHKGGSDYFGIVNIPSSKLPRFYALKCPNRYCYLFIDDIIRQNLGFVFNDYKIMEAISFKFVQDESLNIEDEFSGNLVEKVKNQLNTKKDTPTNVTYESKASVDSIKFLKKYFKVKSKDLVPGGVYQSLKDLARLPNPVAPKLDRIPIKKVSYGLFEGNECIFKKIDRNDHLLHFPYHSYKYVLRFFNEASVNSEVKEIRVTLYRVGKNSAIANALISAALNGKRVIVFMEIKAREDEAHNIYWAEEMEKAGVTVVYSMPELKVHAKMVLVVKETETSGERYYAYLSTGNFNEHTAKYYSDFGLLTSKKKLTKGVLKTFDHIYKKRPLVNLGEILVTKINLKKRFIRLIENEMKFFAEGKPAQIIIKVNNLEEKDFIDKLYEAANAGVQIYLLVRSICCFNIKQVKSSNVKVIRIVDSYLEHARVFYFHNQGKEIIYMSSADLMQRNINGRVEIAFPILKKQLKKKVYRILQLHINDNQKAVEIDHKLRNIKITNTGKEVRAQYQTPYVLENDAEEVVTTKLIPDGMVEEV
ncbi:MAG: polyphosphate kinase 1 [Bacteroidota bacterium]